jgi:hypothetical protein
MATIGPFDLERMVRAVEKVRERLLRATGALNAAGIPYAVVGGNAVAAWVTRVDEAAVRNTQDVDLLIRRDDLERVKAALTAIGFVYKHSSGIDMFLDGPDAKARDAVHIVFAGEKVRPEHLSAAPDVDPSEIGPVYRTIALESLVRMKLNAFRFKDKVHLLDMISVGLIDKAWTQRFEPELADRLQQMLDNPDG